MQGRKKNPIRRFEGRGIVVRVLEGSSRILLGDTLTGTTKLVLDEVEMFQALKHLPTPVTTIVIEKGMEVYLYDSYEVGTKESLFDGDKPKPIGCPKCGRTMKKSNNITYTHQCYHCDEDFDMSGTIEIERGCPFEM